MWKIIDQIFGREGFKNLYGRYPRAPWQAYFESFLRLIYYLLFLVAGVSVLVALSDREDLTVGMALIFVSLAGFGFKAMRAFASRSLRGQEREKK